MAAERLDQLDAEIEALREEFDRVRQMARDGASLEELRPRVQFIEAEKKRVQKQLRDERRRLTEGRTNK